MKFFLNKKSIFLILFFTLFSTQIVSAQPTNKYANEIKNFEEFVQQQMAIGKIPGLSIGFIKDDFIWAKGFGYADLENKIPATEKSAYRLASNTKSMTAVAILQLVEKGKIDLEAEVQTYVPYFPKKQWPVTVRQLLGHLGGISHYKNYDLEGHIKEHRDTRESLDIFDDFDLVAEPGTKYNYSSYGYNLLGAVIESAAKQSYGDFLKENLWNPLGMTGTYLDDPYLIIPNRVKGYQLVEGDVKNSEFVDISSRFAAGGTRSTVVDLLKYARGLNEGKVLSKENLDLMFTSMATKDGRLVDYGMGWAVNPVNGRFHVHHTGGQPETRTLLVQFPQENFYIALAYNLEGANLHVYPHHLFQLIMDEAWNLGVYTGSKIDDAIFNELNDSYNFGLAYFDRYGRPLTTDRKELTEAFEYFQDAIHRDSLASNYKKFARKIQDVRHPIAKQAFVKIGSYLAMKLKEKFGQQGLEKYHQMGAITFFNDYLSISNLADEFNFSNQLKKTITDWNQDWEKTCNDFTRRLVITPLSDFAQIDRQVKKIFSNAKIYPDFSPDLATATTYFYLNGNPEKALKTAQFVSEIYPNSPLSYVSLANAFICVGKRDEAIKSYKKALEINPEHLSITAGRLNQYATELVSRGQLDKAEQLLNIAIELYPKEPIFYNSIAEIYLRRGKVYFEKSLKIDPNYEPARNRLKEIW